MLRRFFLSALFLGHVFSTQAHAGEAADFQIVTGTKGTFILNTKTGRLWQIEEAIVDNVTVKYVGPIEIFNSNEEVWDFLVKQAEVIKKIKERQK